MNARITIIPDVCEGKPTIRGMRITVKTVLEYLAAGESAENILKAYPVLEREDISEIIVNGLDPIWIEIQGALQKTEQKFSSTLDLQTFVRKVLSQQGRKVDFQTPFADCSFRDHFRLHVAVPPIAKKGICVTIRRHSKIWLISCRQKVCGA